MRITRDVADFDLPHIDLVLLCCINGLSRLLAPVKSTLTYLFYLLNPQWSSTKEGTFGI